MLQRVSGVKIKVGKKSESFYHVDVHAPVVVGCNADRHDRDDPWVTIHTSLAGQTCKKTSCPKFLPKINLQTTFILCILKAIPMQCTLRGRINVDARLFIL